jgi:hypothetical protein
VMKIRQRKVWVWLAAVIAGWALAATAMAQHAHLNAGAVGSTAGNPLYFANGFNFITNSGYFLPLKFETNGPYAGHHQGYLTLTSIPATGDNGGPAFGHAAFGARIEAEVVQVDGPVGGTFGFWDSDGEEDATELTFSVPVGERAGTQRFRLSENQGQPGDDPYGHIHGRRFSATVPGLYVVAFRLVDKGGNGPGGGPLHPASEVFPVYLQAGTTVGGVSVEGGALTVVYASERLKTYWLERASRFPASAEDWSPVAGPLAGTGKVERLTGVPMADGEGWFRLRVE